MRGRASRGDEMGTLDAWGKNRRARFQGAIAGLFGVALPWRMLAQARALAIHR